MVDVAHIEEGIKDIQTGISKLQRGPLSFYMKELTSSYNLLIDRFAPFKIGDRVVLTKSIDFNKAPGWWNCKHFLIPGAKGVVNTVSCGEGGFRFGIVFDDESWIDDMGSCGPKGGKVPMRDKHTFSFGETWLALDYPIKEAKHYCCSCSSKLALKAH